MKKLLSTEDYLKTLPRKRVGAAALVFQSGGPVTSDSQILILKPTYKDTWLLPGGVVEMDESPLSGVRRECFEELGAALEFSCLLAIDYLPPEAPFDEAFHFLFKSFVLDINTLNLQVEEILEAKWASIDEACALFAPRLARRSREAFLAAQTSGVPVYLEDGRRAF